MIATILPSERKLFKIPDYSKRTCRGWLNHSANIHFSFDQVDILKDPYIGWLCNYSKISKLNVYIKISLNILSMQKLYNFFLLLLEIEDT